MNKCRDDVAFNEGVAAHEEGATLANNPYQSVEGNYSAVSSWNDGFLSVTICESCGHKITDGSSLVSDGTQQVCLPCKIL